MKYYLFCLAFLTFSSHALTETLNVCQSIPLTPKESVMHLKVYEPIAKKVGAKQVLVPLLVKKWKSSADAKRYDFKVRENISFHSNQVWKPTRNLDVTDIVYSLKANKELMKSIQKIAVKNSQDFSIFLNTPNKNFVEKLTSHASGIKSLEYAQYIQSIKSKQKRKILESFPIGTGPFIFTSYDESTAKFKANEKYHLGEVQYSNLILKYILSNGNRTQLIDMGLCHITYEVDLTTFFKKAYKKFTLIKTGVPRSLYLGMNKNKKVFKNASLRESLLALIDPKKFNSIYYHQMADFALDKYNSSLIQTNMTLLEINPFPNMMFARVNTPASICPKCKSLSKDIADNFAKHTKAKFLLERNDLPKGIKEKQLRKYDLLLTQKNKYSGFNFYKLLDLNSLIAVDNQVRNFYPTKEGSDDFSLVEIITPKLK